MSEGLVSKAKLAEQAERYEDMAKVPRETCVDTFEQNYVRQESS